MTSSAASSARTGAILCMIGSAACWGLATVLTKDILGALPPFTTLVLQLSASVTTLWLVFLLSGQRLPTQAGRAALSGVLEPGLAYGAGVPGLVLTSAASASVIAATEPAVVILIAAIFLREQPGRGVLLAVAVALAGVILITWAGEAASGPRSVLGDGLIFLGVVFAALYVLSSNHLVRTADPLALSALQQSAGLGFALILLAAALASGWETIPQIPAMTLMIALGSGIIQYAAAFWLYLRGMRHLPVQTAALFLTLTPVFGVSGGLIFLQESVTALQWLGSALVVGTLVALARR